MSGPLHPLPPETRRTYFRVVHRSLLTRNLAPPEGRLNARSEESPNDESCACRLCLVDRARFSHFGSCYTIRELLRKLVDVGNIFELGLTLNPSLIFLGLIDDRTVIRVQQLPRHTHGEIHQCLWHIPYLQHMDICSHLHRHSQYDIGTVSMT